MAKSGQPRRGASRRPARKQSRRQVPGWVWLFTGVAAGLFIAFLVHLGDVQMAQAPTVNEAPAQSEPEQGEPEQATAKDEQNQPPKFDFYAVLPKMEVIVPKGASGEESEPQESEQVADSGTSEPTPAETGHDYSYMLQAGSFRDEADADRRRAKLILKGFDVSIQPVQLDNGETWHRVMVGPYPTLTALRVDQDKLIKHGVETLPIRMKE